MELITRHIRRMKGDRELIYKFTTYDIIFKDSSAYGPNMRKLLKHLHDRFTNGMIEAPGSPSESNGLILDVTNHSGHHFSKLANESGYYGQGSRQHEIVQRHFLGRNPNTIAVEVPVGDDEESGCIDGIDYIPENDTLILWDFKPDAHKEKKVSGQLFKYAKLLSKNTGISIYKMRLMYFDGENTYEVNL